MIGRSTETFRRAAYGRIQTRLRLSWRRDGRRCCRWAVAAGEQPPNGFRREWLRVVGWKACLDRKRTYNVSSRPSATERGWAFTLGEIGMKSGIGVNTAIVATMLGISMASVSSAFGAGLKLCDPHGLVRGAEIAMEKGCFGCHTLNTKRVGPPYRDVAAKYQNQPIAVSALAAKIKNGGTGVWGAAVMPPNPVTDEEAETLARWIQSL